MTHPRFRKLFKTSKFTSRLFNVTFDEGHCISQWGSDDFCPEYKMTCLLHWLLPSHVRFHVASATMPPLILEDIRGILHLQSHTIEYVRLSNDRPNIHLMVTEMQHSFSSKQDLDRFIKFDHANPPGDTPSCPPKFMIFTNKRKEAENVAKKFWRDLPEELHYMVVWFHSGMSTQYKEETMEKLRKGEIWGIVCTDAAGMVCSLTFYLNSNLVSAILNLILI